MKIRPIGDRIVIKVIEDTAQTEGGIFIPDSAKEKPQKGEVVAVGLGKMNDKGEREPLDVEVGQKVLYAKYAGTDVKMDGTEYKILSIKDALAIIRTSYKDFDTLRLTGFDNPKSIIDYEISTYRNF